MAKPTKDQVQVGGFTMDGAPWANIAASSGIMLDTLEVTMDGAPWYGVKPSGASPLLALTRNGVVLTNTEVINGVSGAAVSKINGIEF